jgi:hypothetical protein
MKYREIIGSVVGKMKVIVEFFSSNFWWRNWLANQSIFHGSSSIITDFFDRLIISKVVR